MNSQPAVPEELLETMQRDLDAWILAKAAIEKARAR